MLPVQVADVREQVDAVVGHQTGGERKHLRCLVEHVEPRTAQPHRIERSAGRGCQPLEKRLSRELAALVRLETDAREPRWQVREIDAGLGH